MMKKTIKAAILLFAIILVSGCLKYNFSMDIKDDGDVAFKIIYAVNLSGMEGMEGMEQMEDPTLENQNQFKDMGFTVTNYSNEEGYKGFEAIKNYKISEVSKAEPIEVLFSDDELNDVQLFQSLGNGKYKGTFVFDLSTEGNEEMQGAEAMASAFEITYAVTLPRTAISHNATSVDGNTLKWILKFGEKNKITYEFQLNEANGNNNATNNTDSTSTGTPGGKFNISDYYVYIGGGGAVLLIIIIIIMATKKKGSVTVESTPTFAESGAPASTPMSTEPAVSQLSNVSTPAEPVQAPPATPVNSELSSQAEPSAPVAPTDTPTPPNDQFPQ